MAVLELRNVEKVYGNAFKAVHGINLRVEEGEFMALVGPSGCAKSTTLRMIAGLETITGGEIRIGDRVVNNIVPGKRGIAMVFQNYALYPHMKVFNNLSFGLRLAGRPKLDIARAVAQTSELLEIVELLDRLPKQLSGGQAQRVAVGRAIIKQPELFLFDEPLSNLDAKLRAAMRVRLIDLHRQLKAEGRPATAVYVTHDQTEAMTMGDRICVMKDGLIMQVADPVTLYEKPANAFVAGFIGSPEMNLVPVTLGPVDGAPGLRVGSQTLMVSEDFARRINNAAAGAYTLGIRPQHLDIVGRDEPNGFDGQVAHIEFLGHEVYVHVRVEDRTLIVVAQATDFDRTHLGNPSIRLRPKMDRLHLFDIETGRNVSLDDGTQTNNGRKE